MKEQILLVTALLCSGLGLAVGMGPYGYYGPPVWGGYGWSYPYMWGYGWCSPPGWVMPRGWYSPAPGCVGAHWHAPPSSGGYGSTRDATCPQSSTRSDPQVSWQPSKPPKPAGGTHSGKCICSGPCVIGALSGNDIKTFDTAKYSLNKVGRFLLAESLRDADDPCQFTSHIITEMNAQGRIVIDYITASLGKHNVTGYDIDVRISRIQGVVEVKTNGASRWIPLSPGAHNYNFDPVIVVTNVAVPGLLLARAETPSKDCSVAIRMREKEFTGDPYDVTLIIPSPYYKGNMTGVCGNDDADPSNDDQYCPRSRDSDWCRD